MPTLPSKLEQSVVRLVDEVLGCMRWARNLCGTYSSLQSEVKLCACLYAVCLYVDVGYKPLNNEESVQRREQLVAIGLAVHT